MKMFEGNRAPRPDVVADMLKTVFVPVHREGWPFIGLFAVAALALGVVYGPLGWIGAVATAWCVYFFRDPERFPPPRANVVLSPADGVVQAIGEAAPPVELTIGTDPVPRISIFLNVFDVHVNRVPADGTVTRAVYHPGKFLNASLDKASEENERMAVALRLPDDRMLAFVQIAGLVARRIKCDLNEGQYVTAGERYGIIRFGSRADLYLPAGVTPLVAVGQRMVGGETVLAELAPAGE
jgi:phosphatidylserine decarboxylase